MILLYWHTIRHLKAVQFYGRLIHRYWRPRIKLKSLPKLSKHTDSWQKPASRLSSMVGPNDFKFLNELGNLNQLGWDNPSREKLWRYNQHYFDDLNANNVEERKSWHSDLIEKWIVENAPFVGTGWESYPTSLRIVNWIKWHLGGNQLSVSALQSLFIQLRWLNKRLEYHLLGNHLFANAKALVFGGLFFENTEANNWLQKGLAILEREVKEQILPDGGHFELSTMYHALVIEDILDLINILKCFSGKLNEEQNNQVSSWYDVAEKMYFWLHTMCHPDGEISFFNDSTFDVAPSISELDTYAKRLGIVTLETTDKKLILLKDSGYIRIKNDSLLALLDVAKIGPDYLPGHGHADTLSFELSVGDQRVIVNSGTSCYGSSTERLKQRGTLSHNTVTVNGENSSEVWGGFRVARRAYPENLQIRESCLENKIEVHCSHDGYGRLKGKPVHQRSWLFKEQVLEIKDNIRGEYETAVSRFHFHPSLTIVMDESQSCGTIALESGKIISWFILKGAGKLEASSWHPRFGESMPSTCLAVTLIKGLCRVCFKW